jgi:hypothetical protein
MKRTPWFNLKQQPPVHPGSYEWRCPQSAPMVGRLGTDSLRYLTCRYCEWRGLTKPVKVAK